MITRLRPLLVLLVVALAGCGATSSIERDTPFAAFGAAWSSCRPQQVVRVYFGAQMPEGEVDDAAWQRFVADHVAPRFADGFTVIDARGQWRTSEGRVITERTRVLEIVGAGDGAQRRALVETVASYKRAFRQQAVLATRNIVQACI